MKTLTTPTRTDGVNVDLALRHLARIGITEQVLAATCDDPRDPIQLRAEVVTLIASATAESTIVSGRQLMVLQAALGALYTDEELRDVDALVARMAAHARPVGPHKPRYGDPCLYAE